MLLRFSDLDVSESQMKMLKLVKFILLGFFLTVANGKHNKTIQLKNLGPFWPLGLRNFIPIPMIMQIRVMKFYPVEDVLSRSTANLTLKTAKVLTKQGNVVFSPINVEEVLHLILMGTHGKTNDEIATALDLSRFLHNSRDLGDLQEAMGPGFLQISNKTEMATAVFLQEDYKVRKVFAEASKKTLGSSVFNVDFTKGEQTRQFINEWATSRIGSFKKEPFDRAPTKHTKLVFLGVSHFKPKWKYAFDETTKMEVFYLDGFKSIQVSTADMMYVSAELPYYKDVDDLHCEIVGLPYEKDSIMFVVIPENSDKPELINLIDTLTISKLKQLIQNTEATNLTFAMPKANYESSLNFAKILPKLGVKTAVDNFETNLGLLTTKNENAEGRDLQEARSKITEEDDPHLDIGQIMLKTFVEFDSEGLETSNVDSSELNTVKANVPFLFFGFDHDTNLITFWGTVFSPSTTE